MRADSAVVVLDTEDRARFHPVLQICVPRRSNAKTTILVGVVAAHTAAAYLVSTLPAETARPVATESLIAVYVRPRVVVSGKPSFVPAPVRISKDAPLLYDAHVPDLERPTIAVHGVGTMPPHPDEATIDSAPFAREAGLQPGEGATVVLRVEVLGNGSVGRVEVDVSGGAPEIDREAIAYATSLPWTGGMVDGRPTTIWVRWGVRLQA